MKLYEIYLNEIKRPSQSRISRQGKINRDIGARSTNAAEKRNDPLYRRMLFFLNKYKEQKKLILKKYGSRVKSQARK